MSTEIKHARFPKDAQARRVSAHSFSFFLVLRAVPINVDNCVEDSLK
ncbi:unnamed protein product [Haemonchus placei]|uniref:Uncharacterized protein n=1 Tax=Haemonchus placei TaxID=6290 RepID=A0A0N4WAB5_HAEPC|nr:unnamed protein product [Haemonchus placei]